LIRDTAEVLARAWLAVRRGDGLARQWLIDEMAAGAEELSGGLPPDLRAEYEKRRQRR
jgi:hypothetical protein